jgi:hypothetical protein
LSLNTLCTFCQLHGTYRQKDRIYHEDIFFGRGKALDEATADEFEQVPILLNLRSEARGRTHFLLKSALQSRGESGMIFACSGWAQASYFGLRLLRA